MCAASSYWPDTGRLEIFAGFPSRPNLVDRGTADGVGNAYSEAASRNELAVFSGRITPLAISSGMSRRSWSGLRLAGPRPTNSGAAKSSKFLRANPTKFPGLGIGDGKAAARLVAPIVAPFRRQFLPAK